MRSHLRFASVVGALALSTVAVTPAMAAAPVSQSGANAIMLSVAGNANGSGNAKATNDGTTETKSGQETPPVSVLGGQQLLNLGALAQQATARADGTSAACAGVAGDGGSVVKIGDSSCLDPGDQVNATLGALDLTGVIVADPSSPLAPLNDALEPVLGPLTAALNDAVAQARAQFGDIGLVAGFGAIEGSCTAEPGAASGNAILANADIRAVLPEGAPQNSVVLLDLPLDPKPNTHYATNLSDVLDLVIEGLETNLANSINGVADPLNVITDAIQENLVKAIREQVEGNLAPLEADLLDITLNRQIRDGDSIKVRALDLSVLPVLEEQLDAALVNLQIGNAACGPNGRVTGAVAAPAAPAAPAAIPTAVSAGYATAPGAPAGQGDDSTNAIVLGAFVLLMTTAAGFVTVRRLRD